VNEQLASVHGTNQLSVLLASFVHYKLYANLIIEEAYVRRNIKSVFEEVVLTALQKINVILADQQDLFSVGALAYLLGELCREAYVAVGERHKKYQVEKAVGKALERTLTRMHRKRPIPKDAVVRLQKLFTETIFSAVQKFRGEK
jgi:hypothetical protein